MVFLLLALVATVTSSVAIRDDSTSCAMCHFTTSLMGRAPLPSGVTSDQLREHCSKLSNCEAKMSDCELISYLASIQPDAEQTAQYKSFLFVIRLLATKCMFDPESDALEDMKLPLPVKCDTCNALYRTFVKIDYELNNNIVSKDLFPVVTILCGLAKDFKIPDAICYPILGGHALEAILAGIEDSLGPFYNVVGSPFGCPKYTDLASACPSA